MKREELDTLINAQLHRDGIRPNTKEKALQYRAACKGAYEHDDYPGLAGLEEYWQRITYDFTVLEEDRMAARYETPLEYFRSTIDSGFYPPPEVLLTLCDCFDEYYRYGGTRSLDEIFFGKKHKKKSSEAFKHKHDQIFGMFDVHRSMEQRRKGATKKSLTEQAADYLTSIFSVNRVTPDLDPETFLRNYRRWKTKGKCARPSKPLAKGAHPKKSKPKSPLSKSPKKRTKA